MIFTLCAVIICFCLFETVYASTSTLPRAPGWGELTYEPPAPGTYELPVIKPATDGEVLTSDSSPSNLFNLMSGKIVFLSFIFTRCTDENGCPLANAVLYKVQARLNQNPDLANKVSLLTVSFDPEYDTPEVLSAMKDFYGEGSASWQFLTTRNLDALQPILNGYGQYPVRVDHHLAHNEGVVEYIHLLRVYLIDLQMQIRNIYSVSFLHPDILMNDLETLLMESRTNQ